MDFMTQVQTATQVLGILQGFDSRILALRIEMTGKGYDDDAQIPQADGDDSMTTFGERIADWERQKSNIESAYEGYMNLVGQVRDLQAKNERARLEE